VGSVLAIVSKAVFEAAGGAKLSPGDRFSTDRYVSGNKGLAPLADGGDLYLVTVRPGDVLWLVAVLRAPTFDGAAWIAAPNAAVVRDLTADQPRFRFANGKGLQAKAGALGMSLQTPRLLVDSDLVVLGATPADPPATPPPDPRPPERAAPAAAAAAPVAQVAPAEGDPALLARILVTWRATPWAALVPAAVALSERLESPAARALRSGDKVVDDAAWNAVLARGDEVDLGALFATFHRAPLPSLLRRAAALVDLPPDPRLAHLLHRLLQAPPFRATSSQPVWNQVFDAVLRHPDPATLAVVRKVAATEFPSGAAFQKYMAAKLAAAEKKLAAAGVEALVPPDGALSWLPDAAPPAPPQVAPAARKVPAPAWPRVGPPGASTAYTSTTARFLRRSPTGSWAAAWVADPSEREGQPELKTAALVAFDVATREVLVTHPLPPGAQEVFALGHAPGRIARVRGVSVEVVERDGAVASWQVVAEDAPPTQEGEGSVIVGLAFSPGDRELVVGVNVDVGGTDRHDRHEARAVVLSLADGATRELWRSPPAGDPRDAWQRACVWATDERVVWCTDRATRVWDRRWGAFSQVVEYRWAEVIGDGRSAAVTDTRTAGWTHLDLDTGAATVHAGALTAVDVWGSRVLLRAMGEKRYVPAGPLSVAGLDGRAQLQVDLPAEHDEAALLFDSGLAVAAGDHVVLHPGGGAVRWTNPRADHLAAGPGVRATATGSRAHLETPTGPRVHQEEHPIRALAFAPDGRTLYVAVTRSVRAVPLGKGKPKAMAAHAYPVTALAVAPDGTVVSAGEDHLVVVWDAGGTVRHRLTDAPGAVLGVAVDPDGTRVASVGDDGVLRVHDLTSGRLSETLAAPGGTGCVAWGADGRQLAWLDADGLALHTDGVTTRVSLPAPLGLAAHPDRPLYVVSTADGRLHGVLPDSATRVLTDGYQPAPTALVFGPDGALLVGAGAAGTVSALPLTWEVR
jgi:DNA-binding beta-propeller fold protein YncE